MVELTVTEFVARCRDEGRTIILSTHIMTEVEKLCDDVAIVHHGKLLDQGPVGEVKERHKTDSIEDLFFSLIDACDAVPSS